ncbi:hypothetical protein MY11210_004712 [Beauveria gryllotalpidicola]
MEIIVDNRFRVDYVIGHGSYSSVYHGTELENGREVALKVCHIKSNALECLMDEAGVLAAIGKGKGKAEGIPTRYWFGRECEYYVIVQELLGPTLHDLLNYCDRFSFKTILLIADQSIQRLEFIHSKGYLHGDIKPTNMAMGQGEQGNVLYFFDFGIARKFGHDEEWRSRHGSGLFCTEFYASPNIIDGKDPSWADDLESLGYIFLRCFGKISWVFKCEHKGCHSWRSPARCKLKRPSVQEMCEDLPEEFLKYFDHIRSLAHGQKPDYGHLRELFRRAFRNNNYQDDNLYDWTLKLFDEVHDTKSTPEENPKPAEEQPKPAEEQPKPAEEQPKPAEEQLKSTEEQLKPAEETMTEAKSG